MEDFCLQSVGRKVLTDLKDLVLYKLECYMNRLLLLLNSFKTVCAILCHGHFLDRFKLALIQSTAKKMKTFICIFLSSNSSNCSYMYSLKSHRNILSASTYEISEEDEEDDILLINYLSERWIRASNFLCMAAFVTLNIWLAFDCVCHKSFWNGSF